MADSASFADQVRKCIDECGMTRYALAKATGVDQGTLSRFMNAVGNAGLSMDALNSIADVISMTATLHGKTVKATASQSRRHLAKGKSR